MTATPGAQALRRGFTVGIVVSVAVIVLLGVVIKIANSGHHRPEGIAEDWLSAVSDTGRSGVRADAVERAEAIGPLAAASSLIPKVAPEDEALFDDLEVGKAVQRGDSARVPFRLHQNVDEGDGLKTGVVLLERTGDDWRVTRVGRRAPAERVPSEGGEPPSSAPLHLWAGAILLGLVLTLGSMGLVEWADRSAIRSPSRTLA